MYRYEDLYIRKFEFEDIPLKIKWINDPANNKYLHYDLPLEYEKTCAWFEKNKDRKDRFDGVIVYNEKPIGLIGLLNIDYKNGKAEEYILIGVDEHKGKRLSVKAGHLNVMHALYELNLNKVYAYTETENYSSYNSFRRRGYASEGVLRQDVFRNGRYYDRFVLGLCKEEYQIPEGIEEVG